VNWLDAKVRELLKVDHPGFYFGSQNSFIIEPAVGIFQSKEGKGKINL